MTIAHGYISDSIDTTKEVEIVKSIIPHKIYDLLKKHAAILAGGAITSILTNTKINDFDIYSRNVESFNELKSAFDTIFKDNIKSKFSCSYNVRRHLSVDEDTYGVQYSSNKFCVDENIKFQLIFPHIACGNIEQIFMSFDFTCVQGAYCFKTENFKFSESFIMSLVKKELKYNLSRNKHEVSTIFRVEKYKEKGFTIDNFEQLKIAICQAPNLIKTYGEFSDEIKKVPVDHSMAHVRNCLRNISYEKWRSKKNDSFNIINFCEELSCFSMQEPEDSVTLESLKKAIGKSK